MSLVGWRPLMPRSFEMYSPEIQEAIVRQKPGLTGLGSIVFRDEEAILENTQKEFRQCYEEDIAPLKGKLELWYGENRSMWMDLKILCFALQWWSLRLVLTIFTLGCFLECLKPDPDGEIARVRAGDFSRRQKDTE